MLSTTCPKCRDTWYQTNHCSSSSGTAYPPGPPRAGPGSIKHPSSRVFPPAGVEASAMGTGPDPQGSGGAQLPRTARTIARHAWCALRASTHVTGPFPASGVGRCRGQRACPDGARGIQPGNTGTHVGFDAPPCSGPRGLPPEHVLCPGRTCRLTDARCASVGQAAPASFACVRVRGHPCSTARPAWVPTLQAPSSRAT